MRSTAWPYGAYRQHSGDYAPKAPIETISGVLHIKDTIFGHKWVYKLNETRRGAEKKIVKRIGKKCIIWIIFLILILGLMITAITYTLIGSKCLDNTSSTNNTYNKWFYKLFPKLQNKQEFTVNNSKKLNYTRDFKLELNSILTSTENFKISVPGCENCSKNEICLQNSSEAYPQCVVIKDDRDPTGCGGICKLEVQYCKNLNKISNIFGCIDIETLACAENEWKCQKSFMCISKNQVCDGKIQCSDRSDEHNCQCNLKNNFRCGGNISCIPNTKKCDGSVDCWDASDEIHCTKDCGPRRIPCYNGECISIEKWCNGYFDCKDKSDEPIGCNLTL